MGKSEAGVTSTDADVGGEYGDPGVSSCQGPPLGVAGIVRRKEQADTEYIYIYIYIYIYMCVCVCVCVFSSVT